MWMIRSVVLSLIILQQAVAPGCNGTNNVTAYADNTSGSIFKFYPGEHNRLCSCFQDPINSLFEVQLRTDGALCRRTVRPVVLPPPTPHPTCSTVIFNVSGITRQTFMYLSKSEGLVLWNSKPGKIKSWPTNFSTTWTGLAMQPNGQVVLYGADNTQHVVFKAFKIGNVITCPPARFFSPSITPTRVPSSSPTTSPTTNPSTNGPPSVPSTNSTTNSTNSERALGRRGGDDLNGTILVVSLLFIFGSITIAVAGSCHAKAKKDQRFIFAHVLAFGFYAFDFISDLFFTIELQRKRRRRLLFLASVGFVALPYIVNFIQLFIYRTKWSHDPFVKETVVSWMARYSPVLILTTVITGSAFASVKLLNCHLFDLPIFSMGLTQRHIDDFTHARLWSSILLENVPQLVIQIFALAEENGDPSLVLTFALISSILSAVYAIINILFTSACAPHAFVDEYAECVVESCDFANIRKTREFCKRSKVIGDSIASALSVNEGDVEVYNFKHFQSDNQVRMRLRITCVKKDDKSHSFEVTSVMMKKMEKNLRGNVGKHSLKVVSMNAIGQRQIMRQLTNVTNPEISFMQTASEAMQITSVSSASSLRDDKDLEETL